MDAPRIIVVHDSPQVRETLMVLLEPGVVVVPGHLEANDVLVDQVRGAELVIADIALASRLAAHLPNDARLLWLRGNDRRTPAVAAAVAAELADPFSPEELRATVAALLAKPRRAMPRAATAIDYPLLSRAAARLARCAESADLPVLICGEPGTGKARVARSIHAAHPRRQLLRVPAGSSVEDVLSSTASADATEGTLLIEDLLTLPPGDIGALGELLDTGGFATKGGWLPVRLISCAAAGATAIASHPCLPAGLRHRIGVLTIELEALRDRADDLPALIELVADRLTRALGKPAVSFTAAAQHRLCHYRWFGNLAELEAVLARSIALAPTNRLDVADLRFGHGAPQPTVLQPTQSAVAATSEATHAADLIIQELAHEFRNPLVAIKTVTQQLDYFTRDEEGRQHVAKLAGDAVDRMDRTLDNLVQFSEFGTPAPDGVRLRSLLDDALASVEGTAGERRIAIDCTTEEDALVHVDAEQVSYALGNLLRAVLRDVDDGHTIAIRSGSDAGSITIDFEPGGLQLSSKLASLLDREPSDSTSAESLGFLFARRLLERNSGQIETTRTADSSRVVVHLPVERNAPAT